MWENVCYTLRLGYSNEYVDKNKIADIKCL